MQARALFRADGRGVFLELQVARVSPTDARSEDQLRVVALVPDLMEKIRQLRATFAAITRYQRCTTTALIVAGLLLHGGARANGPAVSEQPIAVAASSPAARQELKRLYEAQAQAPLWIDVGGQPNRNARDALALLADAAADGLNPATYRAAELAASAAALQASPSTGDDGGVFDAAMSAAVLRYLRQLHAGRVDPRSVGFRVPARQEPDYVALLREALAGKHLAATANELMPTLPQYRSLRALLARYRTLATDTTLEPLPPSARSVRPEEPFAGVRALQRRLVAFGDLAPQSETEPAEAMLYDGALVDGVKRFQARHGLEADGILGKSTLAALQVSPAVRVRQIELALERLRWLPDFDGRPFVAINIPMFRLWATDPSSAGTPPAVAMNVIVGSALNTRTPTFVEEMRHLIFRPYWNVPRSIVHHEILPALARDPLYLTKQDMEIVRGPGDNATPVGASADNIVLLRQGVLRLRQRPGPRNSLGLLKFVFPNDADVYMHGTPAQQLFSRTRRDFSHGCVRLEDPVARARWGLRDQPHWTRERILDAMAGEQPLQVNLKQPLPVILFYTTAVVMPDGRIHFAADIYGHDQRLESALAQRLKGG
jgi:murein L,D-transpeptidase YcbB/YkuD